MLDRELKKAIVVGFAVTLAGAKALEALCHNNRAQPSAPTVPTAPTRNDSNLSQASLPIRDPLLSYKKDKGKSPPTLTEARFNPTYSNEETLSVLSDAIKHKEIVGYRRTVHPDTVLALKRSLNLCGYDLSCESAVIDTKLLDALPTIRPSTT